MSDFRALAAVTGTLQQFLYTPVASAVPGATVRTGPPSANLLAGGGATVNIFLYQVNPNPSWRNRELPLRRHDGSVIQRPVAALDLYYLVSFYGAESKMVPQILLGAAASALHARPLLDPASIPATLDGKDLSNCGLAQQAEVVKFTMIPLSHEELARIWSVFFQTPYALSLAYQCSVVLLEGDLTPEPALPVLSPQLAAAPWMPPTVERIEPQVIQGGDLSIVVSGQGLGDAGRLTAELGELRLSPSGLGDDEVVVELPSALPAGSHSLRLARDQARSNAAWFTRLPRIAGPTSVHPALGGAEEAGEEAIEIEVPVEPPLLEAQVVELKLYPVAQAAGSTVRSLSLKEASSRRSAEGPRFALRGVPAGEYFAQVEVDGASSRLQTDEEATSANFGRFVGPKVKVP